MKGVIVTKRNKRIRMLVFICVLSLILAVFSGCGCEKEKEAVGGDEPVVRITMEDGGVIDVQLDRSAAPITVDNFIKLVNAKFYDGLTIHRIAPGFVIQGGDPTGTGTGGSDDEIKGEFQENGVENPISHERGVISMARSQEFDSASSQFFITVGDATSLDGSYAAFGHVIAGMDEVDKIASIEADENQFPTEPVIISSMKVIE